MKRKILFCLTLILFISYAYAVKVSPVRFDMTIARGVSQEFVINLTGTKGSYNQDLLIYPSDLFMSRVGTLSFDTIVGNKNSAINWIKMENNKISLLEDQAKEIKFKVSIPSNATPGEYYAVIMVEPDKFTKIKDEKNPYAFKMKTRVAVVVVLDVPGRAYEKKGEVTEVKILETDSIVKIASTFKNTGDIHLDVVAEAIIRSADGRVNFGKFDLGALSSSKKEAFIFPDAMRDFEGALRRQLPTGDYMAEVSYNYGYDFKKAKQIEKFSVKRKISLNENSNEFLSLKNEELRLLIPKGGRRTQVVTVTNTDYRVLNVDIASSDWVQATPSILNLKPGEVRNVMLTISATDYDLSQEKETTLSFKTDRGKSAEMKVFITGLKENLVKKTETKKEVSLNLKK